MDIKTALIEGYAAIFESKYTVDGFKSKVKTDIDPKDRSFKNIPRYATGKLKVDFKKWLNIKKPEEYRGVSGYDASWGIGSDGKAYGWSHRAVYGWKKGDTVGKDCIGNNTGKKFKLNSELDAVKQAIRFAKDIA